MSTAATASDRGAPHLDIETQRTIEEGRARRLSELASNERLSLILSTGLLVSAAAALAGFLSSARSPSLLAVAVLVAAYAIAYQLEFEIATG